MFHTGWPPASNCAAESDRDLAGRSCGVAACTCRSCTTEDYVSSPSRIDYKHDAFPTFPEAQMKPTFQRCSVVAVFSVLFAAAILVIPQRGLAQLLQGTIDGNITDSSQAVVSSATVSAKNEGTGFVRDSQTNAEGAYVLSSLPPGNYTLTVKAAGFESYVKTGIVVAANETTRSDIALTVGQVSESITVAAQASTLQTDRADVHTDLNTHLLNGLPMALGRNFQQILAVITPGVSPPQSGQSFGANAARLVGYSVNGASSVTNSTRIDGTSSTNFNSPMAPMYSPALEAIDTVNVVTGSYDAEQGIAGGAAVNITTKSGTNSLHGSLFEYDSDRNLQAYSWGVHGGLPKPEYINNQFGGTIGGPIKKDKLFYLLSYQGTYVNIGNTLYAENPTAAMKEGDLSASPNPVFKRGADVSEDECAHHSQIRTTEVQIQFVVFDLRVGDRAMPYIPGARRRSSQRQWSAANS
jgi:Carboxypeptidase regulatory-like domain